jgi:hypothetical protein
MGLGVVSCFEVRVVCAFFPFVVVVFFCVVWFLVAAFFFPLGGLVG